MGRLRSTIGVLSWNELPCRPWPGLLFFGGHFTILPCYLIPPTLVGFDRVLKQDDRPTVFLLVIIVFCLPLLLGGVNAFVTGIWGVKKPVVVSHASPEHAVHRYCPVHFTEYTFVASIVLGGICALIDTTSVRAVVYAIFVAFPILTLFRWLTRHDRIVIDKWHISRHVGSHELWRVRRDTRAEYDLVEETVTIRGHTIHLRGLFRPDLLLKSLPGLRQPD